MECPPAILTPHRALLICLRVLIHIVTIWASSPECLAQFTLSIITIIITIIIIVIIIIIGDGGVNIDISIISRNRALLRRQWRGWGDEID